jgi:hypothetical protein
VRVEGLHAFDIFCGADAVIEPIQAECTHVDCAACWPKHEDKPQKVPDIPSLGQSEVLGIHTIPGNSDLRYVVQEVLDKNLETGHWTEGQPTAGDQDAEDVAKVGRGNHLNVFDAAKD